MAVILNKELSDALNGCEELGAVDPATGRVYIIVDSSLYRQACEKRIHEAIKRGIGSMEADGGLPLDDADSQLRKELGFPPRQ